MASGKNTIETPVINPQFKPGDATSLPTKVYPASTKMATGGSKNTVDGPGNLTGNGGVYTK